MNNDASSQFTRRGFLRLSGVSAGILLLPNEPVLASGPVDPDQGAAMLFDATRCVGCRSCETACKEWNKLPAETTPPTETTASTWTLIKRFQDDENESFRKVQCLHCLHPACVAVCTVGALRKTKAGPVVYDADKCIGCRYCQYGCPYGVPKFQWDEALGLIGKCTFCADRLTAGLSPACAEACPTNALTFGTRVDMLKQAYSRIQQEPDRYINHVYGETEGGGTSVLFLSAIPFEQIGLPKLGPDPVTHGSTTVMNATPTIITVALPLFSGLYWFVKNLSADKEDSQ